MKINPEYLAAFAAYAPSLGALEKALRKAGADIVFECGVSPSLGKKILITGNGRLLGLVCIEGDSPIRAVKDVTDAVDCGWAGFPEAAGL